MKYELCSSQTADARVQVPVPEGVHVSPRVTGGKGSGIDLLIYANAETQEECCELVREFVRELARAVGV